MFFLKKNEKILSKKNIIKMNNFIPIFLLYKMVYFTEKKLCKKWYISISFLQEKFGKNVTFLCKKNIIFFHVRKTDHVAELEDCAMPVNT